MANSCVLDMFSFFFLLSKSSCIFSGNPCFLPFIWIVNVLWRDRSLPDSPRSDMHAKESGLLLRFRIPITQSRRTLCPDITHMCGLPPSTTLVECGLLAMVAGEQGIYHGYHNETSQYLFIRLAICPSIKTQPGSSAGFPVPRITDKAMSETYWKDTVDR